MKRTAHQALDAAGILAEDIDIVIAGASGLQSQDHAEALALQDLLANNQQVSVTAIKGTLGETYGASGLFQTLAAVCMIDRGIVPPTAVKDAQRFTSPPFNGLLTEARTLSKSRQGTTLLLAQDLFGSTSAVVLRGYQR